MKRMRKRSIMAELEIIDAKTMKGSNVYVSSLKRIHFESEKRSIGRNRPLV